MNKKHSCTICDRKYKHKRDLDRHFSTPLFGIGIGEEVYESKDKYLFFKSLRDFSQKHEMLYSLSWIYKHSYRGNVIGKTHKKSSQDFSAGWIDEQMRKGLLKAIGVREGILVREYLKIGKLKTRMDYILKK